MITTSTLKPCPFCASDGELLQATVVRNGIYIHPYPWLGTVLCSYCQCKRFSLGKTPEAAMQQAVEDWQTRKDATKPPATEVGGIELSELQWGMLLGIDISSPTRLAYAQHDGQKVLISLRKLGLVNTNGSRGWYITERGREAIATWSMGKVARS